MSGSEVFETRRGERVAAAEHLLTAYREMGVAGAHLGKVPGIPDRPLRHEIQRVAAQVLNVIGNLAPGLLEAIEADAAGGTIPPVSDDPEVRYVIGPDGVAYGPFDTQRAGARPDDPSAGCAESGGSDPRAATSAPQNDSTSGAPPRPVTGGRAMRDPYRHRGGGGRVS